MLKRLPYLLLLLLAFSCREPRSMEQFIAAPGPYTFRVDMSDTAVTYDFSFYTRLDGYPTELQAARELPLVITWISPSDSSYTEQVFMPLKGQSTLFTRQVLQPYRERVCPVEPGQWTLSVAIPHSASREILRGLGLTVSKRLE